MQSPMIKHGDFITEGEKGKYTDLMVLRSGAGWYVGTLYQEFDTEGNMSWQEPGSRDSPGYFATKEEAERFLKTMEIAGEGAAELVLRLDPIS